MENPIKMDDLGENPLFSETPKLIFRPETWIKMCFENSRNIKFYRCPATGEIFFWVPWPPQTPDHHNQTDEQQPELRGPATEKNPRRNGGRLEAILGFNQQKDFKNFKKKGGCSLVVSTPLKKMLVKMGIFPK